MPAAGAVHDRQPALQVSSSEARARTGVPALWRDEPPFLHPANAAGRQDYEGLLERLCAELHMAGAAIVGMSVVARPLLLVTPPGADARYRARLRRLVERTDESPRRPGSAWYLKEPEGDAGSLSALCFGAADAEGRSFALVGAFALEPVRASFQRLAAESFRIASTRVTAVLSPPAGRSRTPAMTQREMECLRWTAEGKTSEEIAIILDLSVHTVNHYLTSAARKLGAVNRLHAVARAMRQNLLGSAGE